MVDLLLDRGYAVRVIDNLSGGREANISHHLDDPNFLFMKSDIRDYKPTCPMFKNVDYVFHFAGIGDIVPSIEKPLDYMSVNVQGTVHMLECARAAGVQKFVYAASSSCYGALAAVPTIEDHPVAPCYPYALSKYQGEQAVMHWQNVYGLPVNSIRIFNAYGTRSRTSGAYGAVFGVFLKQKLAGVPFTVVGDGTQTRDFIYVSDVADAFLLAAETALTKQVWNVGAGNPQSINRLVELLGGRVEFIPKRPGEPDCTFADITKIGSDLGWGPNVTFEEGVRRMTAEIEYWRDAPLWGASSIEKETETWFRTMA
jgi:UDP-glucose 4-epimerase